MTTAQRFAIGTKYTTRGANPRLCTVVDVLRTYNSAGDLVRLRYVSTHEFLGQTLENGDVTDTTIAMGNPDHGPFSPDDRI